MFIRGFSGYKPDWIKYLCSTTGFGLELDYTMKILDWTRNPKISNTTGRQSPECETDMSIGLDLDWTASAL